MGGRDSLVYLFIMYSIISYYYISFTFHIYYITLLSINGKWTAFL